MKQAILSVSIDEKNSVEVRFEGEVSFEIPMLGAIEISRAWLIDKIKNDQKVGTAGTTQEEQEEKQVSKSEALNTYLNARTKIEERLQAIARSQDTQKFTINEKILSKL